MTVQDTRTVSVPRQAAPADLPPAAPSEVAAAPVAPALLGRDRPLTMDERQFALGLVALAVILGTVIVVGLLVGEYVWS